MDLHPGDVFAGHRVEGVAGRGGMGVVYRATQLALDRLVALKTIAPALAADASFRQRFVRESKAAAAIEHPNVIPIFSAGEEQDVLYIVMRYVDGPDLRSLVRREGRLSPERAGPIVAQVAAALDAAHARGLVHRDVKPANVLLARDDHAYLTDFGLTKRLHSEASAVTRPGGWVGTLGYVAPEQIRDERVDGRTDVYALGCVLYTTLAGAPPFERSSDEATLWAHLNADPPELPEGISPELSAALHRALAKDPGERFDTAGDFGRAILAAIGRPAGSIAGLDTPLPRSSAGEETRITPPEARPDAAAPPATAETALGGSPEARRATALQDPPPPQPERSDPGSPRPLFLALAVLALVVVAAGALLLLMGGSEPDKRGGTITNAEPEAGVASVRIGSRPTGVAIARGDAYVTRPRATRLSKVDLRTFRRAQRGPAVPRGATDVDAGFGGLWITSATTERLLTRVDLDTGRRRSTPLPEGTPVAVVTGDTAVWVGMRGARRAAFPPSRVLRVDPASGRVVTEVPMPRGVRDLTVGSDAVWVTNTSAPTVTRIDIASGRRTTIRTGRGPAGVALGGGAAWVANTDESTVSRISRSNPRDVATVGVAGQPRGVAYGNGSLFVSSFATSAITRLDAGSARAQGDPTEVSLNPTKLAVAGGAVYVIAQADGTLDRVRVGDAG